MANIQTRKGKDGAISFRVQVRVKGFPPQSATFARKTDAKQWAQDTESAIRKGAYFPAAEAKRRTFGEMVDRYIRDVLPGKPKSKAHQTQQLAWWKSQLGERCLADITPAVLSEYRDKLANENHRCGKLGPASVRRYLAVLSHAFSVAVREWQWLDDSPMRKVSKPKEPRGIVRFLSDDERERLLAACKESPNAYLYPIVVLALSTGMRKMEVLSLRWQDVDIERGLIVLLETKNNERRGVPLVGRALEVIKEHAATRRDDTALLFPGIANPQVPFDIRTAWESALKRAGIQNFRFHDLRHSCASYLAMAGASVPEIAGVLGHRTYAMAARYAHLAEGHTSGILAKMNARIFNTEGNGHEKTEAP